MYRSVAAQPGASSFDIPASDSLDPELFRGKYMRPGIRAELLSTVSQYLVDHMGLQGVNDWLKIWLAGSGASYRWHANNDLDILLGIDFVKFRQHNAGYSGVSDQEIATHLNDQMRAELWPATKNWHGKYEATWYVNPESQDIRRINPYAAYDLLRNEWSVEPSQASSRVPMAWEQVAQSYEEKATTAIQRYSDALDEVRNATNPAHRTDAESRFQHAVGSAVDLYATVHQGRKAAFSPAGGGYSDFSNYLWQHGKRHGWIPALRDISDYHKAYQSSHQQQTYGVELPDADRLVARAALAYLQ